jgi:hypothetical protein
VTPGITPGAVLQDDGNLLVIIEESDINEAIRTIYQGAPPEQLSMAPEIHFPYSGRALIDLVFFNTFLNERATIGTRVLIAAEGGRLILTEVVGEREHEGVLVSDDSIRQALALAENGINNAVTDIAQSQPGRYQIVAVQIFIGRMEVLFVPGGEAAPTDTSAGETTPDNTPEDTPTGMPVG